MPPPTVEERLAILEERVGTLETVQDQTVEEVTAISPALIPLELILTEAASPSAPGSRAPLTIEDGELLFYIREGVFIDQVICSWHDGERMHEHLKDPHPGTRFGSVGGYGTAPAHSRSQWVTFVIQGQQSHAFHVPDWVHRAIEASGGYPG